jgi:hypothetical protein
MHQDVQPILPAGLETHYAAALYAIPEVGRTAGPTRTKWGWDIILFAQDVPAANPSDSEIVAEVLRDGRRLAFPAWVADVAKRLGIETKLDPDVDKTLEDAP